jgi:hypothetical protein
MHEVTSCYSLVETTHDVDDIIITNISGNVNEYRYFPVEIKRGEIAGSECCASYSYLQHVDWNGNSLKTVQFLEACHINYYRASI